MIFDLALGFFFVVRETIYKYCAEGSHTSGGCEDYSVEGQKILSLTEVLSRHTNLTYLSHDLYRSYLVAYLVA